MKNHEFSKIFRFPKNILGVTWGIRGVRARARTASGGLLRRLRLPQAAASVVEVCGMSLAGAGRVNPVVPNLKNMKTLKTN